MAKRRRDFHLTTEPTNVPGLGPRNCKVPRGNITVPQ